MTFGSCSCSSIQEARKMIANVPHATTVRGGALFAPCDNVLTRVRHG